MAVSREQVLLERMKISDGETPLVRSGARRRLGGIRPRARSTVCRTPSSPTYALADAPRQHEPDAVEVMALRDRASWRWWGCRASASASWAWRSSGVRRPAHTLVVELSNDAIGYIPTRESFAQGGYEPMPGSTFYEPGDRRPGSCAAAATV